MSRGLSRSTPMSLTAANSTTEHIRRCHVCGFMNLKPQTVTSCEACGKHVSPFFYFDDSILQITEYGKRPFIGSSRDPNQYGPLVGLTAYWPGND